MERTTEGACREARSEQREQNQVRKEGRHEELRNIRGHNSWFYNLVTR